MDAIRPFDRGVVPSKSREEAYNHACIYGWIQPAMAIWDATSTELLFCLRWPRDALWLGEHGWPRWSAAADVCFESVSAYLLRYLSADNNPMLLQGLAGRMMADAVPEAVVTEPLSLWGPKLWMRLTSLLSWPPLTTVICIS